MRVLRAVLLLCLTAVAGACEGQGTVDARRDPPTRSADRRNEDVPERPNILIVITDDQRADQTLRVMPQTRRLFVRGGTRFERAFATTPLCCPSRASVLTGLYAHNHGIHTNYDATSFRASRTLPAFLKRMGYQTAIAGKYLNGWDITRRPPYFDRWSIEDAYRYRGVPVNVDGEVRNVQRYLTGFVESRARSYLERFERNDSKPWFLYVAPLAPHEPFTPETRYEDRRVPRPELGPGRSAARGKPPWVRRDPVPRPWTRSMARNQLRTLRSVDDLVGSLYRRLRGLDEDRRTLAFFLSDNGYLWGDFGRTDKRLPYMGSVHIPFLMRWPGVVDRGMRDRRMVANIDVMPTVLDAVGRQRHARKLDGMSLLRSTVRRELLLEYWADPASAIPSWRGVITNRAQYVEYGLSQARPLFTEYYDLARDPRQLKNLAPGRETASMERRLTRLSRCRGSSCRGTRR